MSKISSKHFILFLIGVTIISLKSYTSVFIAIGDRDTWLIAIFASVIFIIYLLYLISISIKTESFNLKEIFLKSYPKIISKILLLIFALTLFINSIECAAVEINSLHSTLFLDTPVWYALIFFMLPSFFILNKDIRTILIFIVISVIILIINGVLFFIMLQNYPEVNNLLPIFKDPLSKEVFKCFIYILGSYCTFLIAMPYLKFIDNSKKLKKHSLFAGLIIAIFVIISFILVISSFGPIRAKNIFYPEFVMSQRIKLAGFLEFGEFFFIVQTVAGFFVKYILSTYGILIIYSEEIKNKKFFIGVYSFLVFVLSNFIGSNNYYLHNILGSMQLVNLVAFLIIPLVTFTIYNFKHKKVKITK